MSKPLRVINLKDSDLDDVDILFDLDERADLKEVRLSDGRKGEMVYRIPIVWDQDVYKDRMFTNAAGLFVGDVTCYIRVGDLPRRPRAQEFIKIDGVQYQILRCSENAGIYDLMLASMMS